MYKTPINLPDGKGSGVCSDLRFAQGKSYPQVPAVGLGKHPGGGGGVSTHLTTADVAAEEGGGCLAPGLH